ncbi:MAG: helix-turn-helix transcriptional regulator [Oscillospiraceae bacterium]|nr:helix-turn-helix transcriptional regulator [Oscillospiraceae bacterium]
MRDISKNIRQLRTQKGMTQDELADVLFVTRQTVSNYETGKSRPDVDMLISIAAALDTDVNTVIYGVLKEKKEHKVTRKFIIMFSVVIVLAVLLIIAETIIKQEKYMFTGMTYLYFLRLTVYPIVMFLVGWFVMQGLGLLLKFEPLSQKWTLYVRRGLLVLTLCVIIVLLPQAAFFAVCAVEQIIQTVKERIDPTAGIIGLERTMSKIPVLSYLFSTIVLPVCLRFKTAFALLGAALWIFGFPKKKGISR